MKLGISNKLVVVVGCLFKIFHCRQVLRSCAFSDINYADFIVDVGIIYSKNRYFTVGEPQLIDFVDRQLGQYH